MSGRVCFLAHSRSLLVVSLSGEEVRALSGMSLTHPHDLITCQVSVSKRYHLGDEASKYEFWEDTNIQCPTVPYLKELVIYTMVMQMFQTKMQC